MLWFQNTLAFPPPGGGAAILGLIRFTVLGGQTLEGMYSTLASSPTPIARLPLRSAGTLRRMVVDLGLNTLSTGFVARLLINGVPVGTPISYGAAETGIKTDPVGVAVAANDRVSFELIATGGGIEDGSGSVSVEFIPD